VRCDALQLRLPSIDSYLANRSDSRTMPRVGYRALQATEHVRRHAVLGTASRNLCAFSNGPAHVPEFRGKVAINVDDPEMAPGDAARVDCGNAEA
jgi:hypothetical protein